MSQKIADKADAAEARTQETRSFMQQIRVTARRKYTPEEKVRIVLEGFRREVAIRDLCRREGIKPGLIEGMNPDATILAVGPNLVPPQIPGADRRDVLSGAELRQLMGGHLEKGTARKLGWRRRLILRLAGPILRNLEKPTLLRRLAGLWMPLGKKVAIIGGDFVTCELAEFLVNRGRQVTILAGQQELATELAIPKQVDTYEQPRREWGHHAHRSGMPGDNRRGGSRHQQEWRKAGS